MLPTGRVGTQYIDKISRLIYVCVSNSSLKSIAFKAIMVMPHPLLEKFSRISKADDRGTLERRIDLWKLGKLETYWSYSEKVKQFNET